MAQRKKLSASLEDYLEAIYQVGNKDNAARAKDVSEHLGVAASSVTNALQALVEQGLIHHQPYDVITFTGKGRRLAEAVVRRHEVLTDFFTKVLAVDEGVAADCACKMEHAIPDVVLERLVDYLRFEERCERRDTAWIEGTGFVCRSPIEKGSPCEVCTSREGYTGPDEGRTGTS